MAFSKSSLPLLLSPFINSFTMICESMLSASQGGLSREMLLSKYRLQIFDYIYIYDFIRSWFPSQLGFFWWGAKIIPPLIKHWVGGLLPPATTQIYRVWEMQSTGKCLKSNKVFTTQCLALKLKDRT